MLALLRSWITLSRIESLAVPHTDLDQVDTDEEEPTPWYDAPIQVEDPDAVECLSVDFCTVMFTGSSESPIRFQPKCNCTVGQFLIAQEKLV